MEYISKEKEEYPSIVDQLDDIYAWYRWLENYY